MKESGSEPLLLDLRNTFSLDTFLREHAQEFQDDSMPELLEKLLQERGLSKAGLARRSATSEVYLHQVISGRRRPSRDRLLCLCLGLGAELDTVQELLRRNRCATLYVHNKRDAILIFCVIHHKSVFECNELLDRFEQPLLIR